MELHSIPGQKVRYLMGENPMLVADAVERELEELQRQLDEEARLADGPGHAEEGGAATDGGFDGELRGRLKEVRQSERRRAATELLHLSVCHGLCHLGAPMVAPMIDGGYVHIPALADSSALTSGVHSEEALAAVEDHLRRSLGEGSTSAIGLPGPDARPDTPLKILLFNLGQAYAGSALFGYVLRRAESRFRLDRSLAGLTGGGSTSKGDAGSLQHYLDEAIGPGRFQSMMLFSETQEALLSRVRGVFGDLPALKQHVCDLTMGDPARLKEAVYKDEVMSVRLTVGELRRLLLEAVALGCLLHDSERQAEERYSLTPASVTGLHEFGFDVDGNGDPIVPH